MAATASLYPTTVDTTIGTTWTNTTNATGSTTATFATWTNATSSGAGSIRLSGYAAQTAVGDPSATIDSVAVTVRSYYTRTSTGAISTEAVQLYSGTTAIGSATSLTPTLTTTTNSQTVTLSGANAPTYAQLSDLRAQVAATRAANTNQTVFNVDIVGVVVNYSTPVTLSNSAEGGTNGTAVTTANSGGASGDAFDEVNISGTSTIVFDSTRAARGGMSYKLTVGSATNLCNLNYNTQLGARTSLYARFYYYNTATPTTSSRILGVYDSGFTASVISMYHLSSGKLEVDTASAFPQSTGTLPLNQWIRIEMQIVGGASGSVQVLLFTGADPHATSASETINTGTTSIAALGNYEIGSIASTTQAGFTWWADEIVWTSTGYPGPAASTGPAFIAAPGLILNQAVTRAATF